MPKTHTARGEDHRNQRTAVTTAYVLLRILELAEELLDLILPLSADDLHF